MNVKRAVSALSLFSLIVVQWEVARRSAQCERWGSCFHWHSVVILSIIWSAHETLSWQRKRPFLTSLPEAWMHVVVEAEATCLKWLAITRSYFIWFNFVFQSGIETLSVHAICSYKKNNVDSWTVLWFSDQTLDTQWFLLGPDLDMSPCQKVGMVVTTKVKRLCELQYRVSCHHDLCVFVWPLCGKDAVYKSCAASVCKVCKCKSINLDICFNLSNWKMCVFVCLSICLSGSEISAAGLPTHGPTTTEAGQVTGPQDHWVRHDRKRTFCHLFLFSLSSCIAFFHSISLFLSLSFLCVCLSLSFVPLPPYHVCIYIIQPLQCSHSKFQSRDDGESYRERAFVWFQLVIIFPSLSLSPPEKGAL